MATNNKLEGYKDLLDVVILDDPSKGVQYRLTISEFRGSLYFGVREWYSSYENSFAPTDNGFSMPYTLHTSAALFNSLRTILSKAETLEETKFDSSFVSSLLEKTKLVDDISKITAVPSNLLYSIVGELRTQLNPDTGQEEIVIPLNLPEGSSWLK